MSHTSSQLGQVDWIRLWPFLLLHLGALGVIWVGVSAAALLVALAAYVVRMFAITAFYHRYFSHRAFKMGRKMQFLAALLGNSAAQRGPLWWAAHHRHHHKHADKDADIHSPKHGFFWSHILWFCTREHYATRLDDIQDFAQYPELKWLDDNDWVVPVLFLLMMFGLGALLDALWPSLQTGPWQMLIWGGVISTIAVTHVTLSINSLTHKFGTRRYATNDDSRNNWILAILTLGEGWHNNHHHFPGAAKQGFYWWEIDISYYGIRAMQWLGLAYDLKPVPQRIRLARRVSS